ncbi:MAG: hypothetical protein P4L51_28245 [Puia sp.]|nr:hypothetical protein [Puia sp.]
MKRVNHESNKVFAVLLERLNDHQHMRLELNGYLPLVMEKLEENIVTPVGITIRYSLEHEQTWEGKVLRVPKMNFLVIDFRLDKEEVEFMGIFPCYFLNDVTGTEQHSLGIEHGQVISINKRWQSDHTVFANTWLKNIGQQGFLIMKPTRLF